MLDEENKTVIIIIVITSTVEIGFTEAEASIRSLQNGCSQHVFGKLRRPCKCT